MEVYKLTGGYIMIDASGVNLLAESAQTKAGIYQTVQNAMRFNKPLYAYGLTWGSNRVISPVHVFAIQLYDNTITCTASTLQIVITSSDEITINNLAPDT